MNRTDKNIKFLIFCCSKKAVYTLKNWVNGVYMWRKKQKSLNPVYSNLIHQIALHYKMCINLKSNN